MQRREFLKASTGAGIAAWTAVSAAQVRGANDRLRVGLIGCGGRGTLDARNVRGLPEDIQSKDPRLKEPRNVDIAAVCDVNTAKTDAAKRWTPQATAYDDFRKLLADKSIDAVIIATPDPWHAQMMILACEAGKDVYLEKPVMYRLAEAKAMREAVRRTKRIVQIGSQHRSADHIVEAGKMVQSGKIGEVKFVRVWNYQIEPAGPPVPDSEPPAGLNWDAWLGPSPKVPFNSSRLYYRAFMDYTNGLISDYGNHRFDSVHMVMGEEKPLKVSSSTAMLNRKKAGDIVDFQQATYEYPGFVMSYEGCVYNSHGLGGRTEGMRYYGARGTDDRPHGMAFYGTEAALYVDRIGMELYPESRGGGRGGAGRGGAAGAAQPLERMHMNEDEPSALHAKYFVDFVRNRKEPFANIEVEVRATAIACMGNVAAWTGRKLTWDDASWQFPGDAEANKYLFREYRKPWDLVKFA
ncbi:MAG: Gfo/Idh/MocA family oxidoreductase [Bryobacteraceae bacterium]|jgi:predicted dehydrogenase